MEIKQMVKDIMSRNTNISEQIYEIDENESLLDHGLDSFQMMRVIVEIEKSLNFRFRDEDLLTANFATIASITESVEKALAAIAEEA